MWRQRGSIAGVVGTRLPYVWRLRELRTMDRDNLVKRLSGRLTPMPLSTPFTLSTHRSFRRSVGYVTPIRYETVERREPIYAAR